MHFKYLFFAFVQDLEAIFDSFAEQAGIEAKFKGNNFIGFIFEGIFFATRQ